ncbi:serine hydrolase [Sphingomonas sp.]|uniref:serine hydrolase domain-containing protein n=1 Tax=Sphingomonas sp. TaxID=28214 RepID=UPI0031E38CFB
MSGYLLAAFTLVAPAVAQQPPRDLTPHQRAIAAGYKALALCEGQFGGGRTPEQIAATELKGIYPEYEALAAELPATSDRQDRSVSVPFADGMPPRLAYWVPRFGCSLAPIGGKRVLPPLLHPNPSIPFPADPRPWPIGDSGIAPKPPAALESAVAAAFDPAASKGRTTGVVVLRDGKVIAERYADGFGPLVPNRTWSVAKSIAGTLIGIAVADGKLDPAKPAPVPEWRTPGDPRAAITLDQLLRMASGLGSDTAGNRTDAIYFGGTAVTEQTVDWPIVAPPGSTFRYANNDTLLAVRALRSALADDNAYTGLPGNRLFGPLGMDHTTTGIDWQQNFVLSSQVWSTARDLARLGELWRNDGVWQGKRILPEGWVRYMTTPSGPQPKGDGPGYGATMWLFGLKQGLPDGSYAAQGNRGQYIFVIPSARLVVVRRGEDPAGNAFEAPRFVAEVLKALE